MNKQVIEKAICVMENLKYLLIDVLGNENNEKEFDVAIEKIDELINKTNYELYKAGLEDAKDIILSQQKQLATDNNVVTKSGKDNNVLTIGDKIRESNRSLAYMLGSLCSHGTTDIKTFEMRGWTTKKWLDYLNQPYTE